MIRLGFPAKFLFHCALIIWQLTVYELKKASIWDLIEPVFFSKYVFTTSLVIFHTYYTISNRAFIWGISYQVSFSFHRAEQVMFHKKFHFWTIAKQRFLSYGDDGDEIGCGQWPSPAKPILFLHPLTLHLASKVTFLRGVIPSANRTSIRENICRKYLQSHSNIHPIDWVFVKICQKQVGESMVGSRRTVEHEESGWLKFLNKEKLVSSNL